MLPQGFFCFIDNRQQFFIYRDACRDPTRKAGCCREVLKITPRAVTYRATTLYAGQTMGDPSDQTWKLSPLAQIGIPESEGAREEVKVDGITFQCLVADVGKSRSWVPLRNGVLTFPGVLRVLEGDQLVLQLERIETR